MQKRILKGLIPLIFILCLTFTSGLACTDTNEIDNANIPCEGLTVPLSCSGNVSIFNLNTSEQINVTTYLKVDNRYNFTVNLSEGSYSFVDCANNSATIIVGVFDTQWQIALIAVFSSILFIYIYFGYFLFSKEYWLLRTLFFVCSLLLIVLAVNSTLIISDVANVDKIVETSLTVSIIAVYFFITYILLTYTIEIIRKIKNRKV